MVLSVPSNFVFIWLIVSKILKIQFFLRLAWNCPTTSTLWDLWVLIPWTIFFVSNPLKGTSLGESTLFEVQIAKIYPAVFPVNDNKKKGNEGKVHKVTRGLFQLYWERTTFGRFLRKLAGLNGPRTIILSNFGFSIFMYSDQQGSKSPFYHWLCWSSLQQCCLYRAACNELRRNQKPATYKK